MAVVTWYHPWHTPKPYACDRHMTAPWHTHPWARTPPLPIQSTVCTAYTIVDRSMQLHWWTTPRDQNPIRLTCWLEIESKSKSVTSLPKYVTNTQTEEGLNVLYYKCLNDPRYIYSVVRFLNNLQMNEMNAWPAVDSTLVPRGDLIVVCNFKELLKTVQIFVLETTSPVGPIITGHSGQCSLHWFMKA